MGLDMCIRESYNSIILFCLFFSNIFFFQAEDGIRDRSPSRGLGDVYKRQSLMHSLQNTCHVKVICFRNSISFDFWSTVLPGKNI